MRHLETDCAVCGEPTMDSAFGRTHSDGIDHGHKAEVGSPFPTLWEEDDKPTSKDDVEIREDV